MDFNDIPKVNTIQIEFCKKLGLDVKHDTISVAIAKIEDCIQQLFWGNSDIGSPSEKQKQLALQFGIDISSTSNRVWNAIIDDIMNQLNVNSIKSQNLHSGVNVIKRNDHFKTIYVISSIKDGTVYFKGGNGQKAWARNLIRLDD